MRFCLVLLGAMLMPQAAYAAEGLTVEGNRILYHHQAVRLQGVAVGDPLLARQGRTPEDYKVIAREWNANAVRLSIHPSTWRDIGRLEVMKRLQQEVRAALDAGLFVILAWHTIGVPDGYYQPAPEGLPPDAYDTNFALAQDFWRHMAWQFGADGRILFELWNEPAFAALPEDGGSRWMQLKPYWQQLIAVLRQNGSANIVLATGRQWGYVLKDIPDNLLEDANTAYSWHVYPDSDKRGAEGWRENLSGLDRIKPVVVTEWGFDPEGTNGHQGTAQSFGSAFREVLLSGHALHYTAWCWHPTWTPRMLQPDWRTPTEFGRFVKETLWQSSPEGLVRP